MSSMEAETTISMGNLEQVVEPSKSKGKPKRLPNAQIKTRFLYLHPDTNPGKLLALEALQGVYTGYLQICVNSLLENHRLNLFLSEKQKFFPETETLSSQIVKNVRDHAIALVHGWAKSKYDLKLKKYIFKLYRAQLIDDNMRHMLCKIGKNAISLPEQDRSETNKVTQQAIDLYWSLLLEPSISGKLPTVSDRCGMRLSCMTGIFNSAQEAKIAPWWIGISHLEAYKRLQIPLSYNPYIASKEDITGGSLLRKDRTGKWRLEVIERKDYFIPPLDDTHKTLALDTGMNVPISTSSGQLYGVWVKGYFDRLYGKIQRIRENRKAQGLHENSPKLEYLENKLSGFMKSVAGYVTNRLIYLNPNTKFAIEDLDLRGSRGQKRFAYHAFLAALEQKANVEKVNPAYTSQTCPSCGYVSRSNRDMRDKTKFSCQSCGRRSHADVIGAINVLERFQDKHIDVDADPLSVKSILEERYRARRNFSMDSSPRGCQFELEPSSPGLTTRGSRKRPGTALKLVRC